MLARPFLVRLRPSLCTRCRHDLQTLFSRGLCTPTVLRERSRRRLRNGERAGIKRGELRSGAIFLGSRGFSSTKRVGSHREDADASKMEGKLVGGVEDGEEKGGQRQGELYEEGSVGEVEVEMQRDPDLEDTLVSEEAWRRAGGLEGEEWKDQGWELERVFELFRLNVRIEQVGVESRATMVEEKTLWARQNFRHGLPEGVLSEEEMAAYVRLYGNPPPVGVEEAASDYVHERGELDEEVTRSQLLREDEDGQLEEVVLGTEEEEGDAEILAATEEELDNFGEEEWMGVEVASRRDLQDTAADGDAASAPRFHPLTLAGKFATSPSTVSLPQGEFVGLVSTMLANYSNKHISEAAHKIFGGVSLPLSPSTPEYNDMKPFRKRAVALEASHHVMSEMEANAYTAAVMPQAYAAVMSVLVEVRKRQGSSWIEGLLEKEGGPSILDAGSAGAGVLAWREVLKAEWDRLHPGSTDAAPFGKATVLTGSAALRKRSSMLLENTTFIPRLPDYVHVRDSETLDDSRPPPLRKQFDLIIAPYTLAQMKEDYLRKQHVQNLWSLLNPEGGVLVLLEKGWAKGFEAIAAARELLLDRFISSPDSSVSESFLEDGLLTKKSPGMIIAPCTNHSKCPMYLNAGPAQGRDDFCHFEQRFIRPHYLQRIVGAKKNHEDVRFSYVAVQRGVDQRRTPGLIQGDVATDEAFSSHADPDVLPTDPDSVPADFNTLSLPRAILPAIKRKGHVMMDLCTPAGQLERWTVPKSYGKQAFHDARKVQWGDLWALGAKTRVPRKARQGVLESDIKAGKAKVAGYRPKKEQKPRGKDSKKPSEPGYAVLFDGDKIQEVVRGDEAEEDEDEDVVMGAGSRRRSPPQVRRKKQRLRDRE